VGTVWIAGLLHRADSLGCGLLDCWVAGLLGLLVARCGIMSDGQTVQTHNPTTEWAVGAAWLTCCGLLLSFITPGTFGTQRHASGYPSFLVREGESSEWKRSHVMYSNTSADGPSSYML
jgi:hypothetical protein